MWFFDTENKKEKCFKIQLATFCLYLLSSISANIILNESINKDLAEKNPKSFVTLLLSLLFWGLELFSTITTQLKSYQYYTGKYYSLKKMYAIWTQQESKRGSFLCFGVPIVGHL